MARTRRNWGRLIAKDERDKRYRLRTPKSDLQRKMWKDTHWSGDQKRTPQCVGFAWAHWLDADPICQYLHPAGIYNIAQLMDEWPGEDYDGTSVRAGAKMLQALGFLKSYRWAFNLDQVIYTLLQEGPVVAGTEWYQGMMWPDESYTIRATGRVVGGHAYLLSGVDRRRERFRIKQSWGLDWGFNGHAWLPFTDFEDLLALDGEVCLGIEAIPQGT